jgi:F-type H+-transporting ATPase subunit delta
MTVSVFGKRYANALLQLAVEGGSMDIIGRDLRDFARTWETSKDLRDAFENPQVSQLTRRQIIRDLAAQSGMHATVRDTLSLLADRKRLRHVGEVADAYEAMAETRSGRLRAEITTAAELSDAYFAELEKTLREITGRDITLVRKVDPSLVGGVVARVGDQVFDGSLKNRLAELKTELLQ